MTNYKFEYIWMDGVSPTPNLRAKTKIMAMESFNGKIDELPMWSFDGSSTEQAEGGSSDCLLKPVRIYIDPFRENGFLVIAEVLNADGTPHATNTRSTIHDVGDKEMGFWWGFEQEYVLMTDNGRPLGFPSGGYPEPQGPYYCAVGDSFVSGRDIVEDHMELCLDAEIGIKGVNAEVMLGQWEYQVFGKGALKTADDLMMSRYLLLRLTEKYQVRVELHPKPLKGDWNGSGMHCNYSWNHGREIGGKDYFTKVLDGLAPFHEEHIASYGHGNEERLTGRHETASMDKFSWGVSDRGASIRVPIYTVEHNWKGYIEDRRPASNADPYLIVAGLVKATIIAHNEAIK